MADTGELHKRTKSALSLLRRSVRDEDNSPEASSGSFASQPTTSPTAITPSAAHDSGSKPHQSRISTATASLQPSAKCSRTVSPPNDKSLTIEQSVRKFRIFEALRNGDTASISKAIRETGEGERRKSTSSGMNVSGGAGSLEDTTILHLAIQCAELTVIEYVLSDGTGSLDINARDREGNTPLHVAAVQGRGQVVRLLLEQEGINDAILNYQGKLPLDLARTPDIFQQLQLSRSIFVDAKIKEVHDLVGKGDYDALGKLLEEPRVQTLLDINNGEFASDAVTIQSGGTLLHEAARNRDTKLIQVLLLHGADPFRRDRKGKLPQDVTKDDLTKAMLKKSPAAVAAQRGIQEKAVLGNVAHQGAMAQSADILAGKEGREMKGYLKKWTNYRTGFKLRWFVLEDGVLSYYKHQDDSGSACRGAINMRIARLNMDPSEKTKFEIIGKSSVKYHLKANHEVEAKRWFWALNNSIQWSKDQAKEETQQRYKNAEMLRQAKAEALHPAADAAEGTYDDTRRNSYQSSRAVAHSVKSTSQRVAFTGGRNSGSVDEADENLAPGSYEPSYTGDLAKVLSNVPGTPLEGDNEDEYEDDSSREVPASRDAFNITAQSAKMQMDMMSQVHAALQLEQTRKPDMTLSDPAILHVVAVFDDAMRNLNGLLGDLVKISKDRDAYWQYRLDREANIRRMWEESMAVVAKEQDELQVKMSEVEAKRKATKRALRDALSEGVGASRPESRSQVPRETSTVPEATVEDRVPSRKAIAKSSLHRTSSGQDPIALLDSDSEADDDDEFFDAVDAGEVDALPVPPPASSTLVKAKFKTEAEGNVQPVATASLPDDLASAFMGYEDGIRKRLAMDADDRPKISLWGILKSMIGKDMTKMTLPVSFNEPTSLLQRCAEDMEYAELLDLAASRTDSTERMVFVAAFAASEYSSTIGRVAKPFNPLLGETFEYARPDKGYRFFIEQVSHHPPIGAAYADSQRWTYYGESAVKSKFYGKSFDIDPLGTWFLRLRPADGSTEELYTWKKVTTSVIGIITGSPTIDNYGPMNVVNHTTGENCVLDFKPRGWKASSAYQISGKVNDVSGQPRFSIGGHWDSKIYARLTPGFQESLDNPKNGSSDQTSLSDPSKVFIVWQAHERPKGIPFNLTPFGVTLNAITDNLRPWLPPTDTRLRPDQRAMEDGEYDFAATEKNRVEEKQRRKRREREAAGEEFVPRWFNKSKDATTGEEFWLFNGEYWRERANAGSGEVADSEKWKGVEDIFGE